MAGIATLLTAIVGLIGLLHGFDIPSLPGFLGQTTSGGKPGVLMEGTLAMGVGDFADLDRGFITNTPPGDHDLYLPESDYDSRSLKTGGRVWGGSFLAQVQGQADEGKCSDALKVRHDEYVNLSRLRVGSWFCLHTTRGNVAAVRIVSLTNSPSQPPRLDFAFITWEAKAPG